MTEYTARGETFIPEKPRQWCETPILLTGVLANLDLAPDGKRFAVFSTTEGSGGEKASFHVTFLLNFFDELRRRLPAGNR